MMYLLDADWVVNALVGRRRAAEILIELSPEGNCNKLGDGR